VASLLIMTTPTSIVNEAASTTAAAYKAFEDAREKCAEAERAVQGSSKDVQGTSNALEDARAAVNDAISNFEAAHAMAKEAAAAAEAAGVALKAANKRAEAAAVAAKDAASAHKGAEAALKIVREEVTTSEKAAVAAVEGEKKAKIRAKREAAALDAMLEHAVQQKALEERFNKIFDDMDKTKKMNGVLSHNELKAYVATKDPTLRLQLGIGRWQDFLATVDTDGDGMISRDEFVSYFTMASLNPVKCWGAIFDAIDTNRDGCLSRNELRCYEWNENPHILKVLGFTSWSELMRTVDINGDGRIDRDEWLSYFVDMERRGEWRASKRAKRL